MVEAAEAEGLHPLGQRAIKAIQGTGDHLGHHNEDSPALEDHLENKGHRNQALPAHPDHQALKAKKANDVERKIGTDHQMMIWTAVAAVQVARLEQMK